MLRCAQHDNKRRPLDLPPATRYISAAMTPFDPATLGYALHPNFDRLTLEKLLEQLGQVDPDLERHLRDELLGGSPPHITQESFERLRELSPTNGAYSPEEEIARMIGEILFGKPLAK
jgi:hypothetical protein